MKQKQCTKSKDLSMTIREVSKTLIDVKWRNSVVKRHREKFYLYWNLTFPGEGGNMTP